MIMNKGKIPTSISQLGDDELCMEFHEGLQFTEHVVTLEVTTNLDVIVGGDFSYVCASADITVNDGLPQLADTTITEGAVTVVRKAHVSSATMTFDGFLWGYKTGS